MLRPEIEPFANFHRENLIKILDDPDTVLTADQRKDLEGAAEAFVRFRVCMLDEVDQKARLRAKLYENKLIP